MRKYFILLPVVLLLGCSTKYYAPDSKDISSDTNLNDSYSATVDIIIDNEEQDKEEITSIGVFRRNYHIYSYQKISGEFVRALSREVIKRGGKVVPDVEKKIYVKIQSVFVASNRRFPWNDLHSKIKMRLSLSNNYETEVDCRFVSDVGFFTTEVTKEELMNGCLSISLNKILGNARFIQFMKE